MFYQTPNGLSHLRGYAESDQTIDVSDPGPGLEECAFSFTELSRVKRFYMAAVTTGSVPSPAPADDARTLSGRLPSSWAAIVD